MENDEAPEAQPTAAAFDPYLRDREHLTLLTIFYAIIGVTTVLAAFGFIYYIVAGTVMESMWAAPTASTTVQGGPPSATPFDMSRMFAGYAQSARIMVALGYAGFVVGWILGGLMLYAAKSVRRRVRRKLILATAGITCVLLPFGTILGVFTFVVLARPSIQSMFTQAPSAAPRLPA